MKINHTEIYAFNKEWLFIALYYRQLSTDIRMKNYKIKTSFVNLRGSRSLANKSGINLMIFILLIVKNCL